MAKVKHAEAKKTVLVEQYASGISGTEQQRETLRGLGLRRIRHRVERGDTASVRGAVKSIAHLARIVEPGDAK